jgi:signal peptidase II
MKKSGKVWLFCIGCFLLISWDKTTKEMAKDHLMNKGAVSYFHDTFRLEYVENTGAAMSLGDHLSRDTGFWLLCAIPLLLLVCLFVYAIRHSSGLSMGKLSGFALIIAGGIGNILDRFLFDRHVTDFMNIGVLDVRTGIFNFADVWVSTGAVVLILSYRKKAVQIS